MDHDIRKVRVQRLAAETDRLKAQEAAIRDRLNTPWYEKAAALNFTKAIAQGLFTVVIGLPLVWFYVEQVIKPATQAKNLQLEIEILGKERALNQEINKLQNSLQNSNSAIDDYKKQLATTKQELNKTREQIKKSESSVKAFEQDLTQASNVPQQVIQQVKDVTNELQQTKNTIQDLEKTVEAQTTEATKTQQVQGEISKTLKTEVKRPIPLAPQTP